ncbi:Crossover junction endonuclease [Lachnellula occidentalis]|uniref:Crossover junction endonuclease n=1 Tax=Lachnellula occidentalis TaxID=215460 RepID=A0A8H8S1T4_9HELO|nr:Crossover junction endonuclease [Lachnellula occidentalis]
MPEVIDLCSSPPQPPSRRVAPVNKTRPTAPAPAPAPAPSKSLASKAPTNIDDDLTIISSDDDSVFNVPGISVPKISRPSAFPTTKPNTSKPPSKPTVADDVDVFFQEDDFDSTVNLDDSVLNLPPAKRQRLSPTPKAAPIKSTGYKRSVSNIETSSKGATSRTHSAPILRKAKTALEDDEILFTSSPDLYLEARKRRDQKKKADKELDDFNDDIFGLDHPRASTSRFAEISDSSEEDFPDVDNIPMTAPLKPVTAKSSRSKSPKGKSSEAALAKYNRERAAEKKSVEKSQAARARELAKKDKGVAKEAEKERKALEKEKKKWEKERNQELAKVNVSRNDKKISTSEMIVEMSSGLDSITADVVRKQLDPLQVEHSTWNETAPIVKWKRKVQSKYDDEKGHWVPTPAHIKAEEHIIYIMTAEEFVERVTADERADVDIHVLQLRAKFESCKIIYLIQGYTVWTRKNRNFKNRKFTESVNSQMPQEAPTATQRKKKKEHEYVDENILEDALLRLQVIHGAMIHHVMMKHETAEWIVTFTQHISTIPYKSQKDLLDTAFCMESGQVKSGEDANDTYSRMLQEIIRITAPVAYGIMAEYPSAQKLVKGLKDNGPLALEECRKMANKNGAFTDRRVGPAISRRVHSVFTGTDPGSFDV